jgi:5-methylcytosine-specific restriction endonuclease McrA
VTIADLYFEGDLGMPPADVEQVASALKQQTYSGEPDEVVDEVLERARRAWQDHGYFKVQVHGARKMLTSSPGNERVAITVQVEAGETYDQLRYAEDLLGYAEPSGDVAKVFQRALDALVDKLERQKFAKCVRSRPQRGSTSERYVPAAVRRIVWQRDGGQCTFVSDTGRRCEARRGIQFDHVDPVARGGEATVAGIRLLCPAHNQHAAEQTFGAEFMRQKREAAKAEKAAAVTIGQRMQSPQDRLYKPLDASLRCCLRPRAAPPGRP